MITITVNNDGKVMEVNAIAYLLIAYEEAAPRYGSISLMGGDFDDEMLDNLKIDFDDILYDEDEDEDKEKPLSTVQRLGGQAK